MKHKYYHESNFKWILKLVSENYYEQAINAYENYLAEYPKDICAYAFYVDALITVGRLEQATEVLNSITITSKTTKLSAQDIMLEKLKLLSCKQEYGACLEIIRDSFEAFDERNWNCTEPLIFFKKKLGLLLANNYDGFNYKISQITNYSEEKAIECIKKYHCIDINSQLSTFNDSFSVEEVYYELRKLLPLDSKIYNDIIENTYIFKYENCGRANGKIVNYIKVITLQGSNDIITMYPYENRERRECIDLTPKIEDAPKVKRISQIDKFNQRYGKKLDNH